MVPGLGARIGYSRSSLAATGCSALLESGKATSLRTSLENDSNY